MQEPVSKVTEKRFRALDSELRSQKRARTSPLAQNECNLRVPPTRDPQDKLGPTGRFTTSLADQDSSGHEKSRNEAPELATSSDEDNTAEAEESSEQLTQPNRGSESVRNEPLSLRPQDDKDKSCDFYPENQSLESMTGDHDNAGLYHSSNTHTPPEAKISCNETDGSASGLETPDLDRFTCFEQSGPWSQPSEPLRPENPYTKGRSLKLYRHKACAPFGQDYTFYDDLRDRVLEEELRQKTLVELCLENPPMEGQTVYEDSQNLEIVEELRVKSDGGAQLVVCHLDDDDQDYIAKIYDPMYYGFSNTTWADLPRDVTFQSDMDYCREVAAYEEMDEWVGGTYIPKFFGSWTFQISLDLPTGRRTRDVRMILIERISGKSMLESKPDTIAEPERLETLARMSELISKISFIGVHHHDISQRNIMICEGENVEKVGRIVLIDFNMSTVERLNNFEEEYGPRGPGPDKPPSPLDWWWSGGWYGGFWEWLPRRWEQRLRPLQEWMYNRWNDSDYFAPPIRGLEWDEDNQPRSWIAW